jgi:hypothetical protein
MEWVKQKFDVVILLLATVLLAVNAGLIISAHLSPDGQVSLAPRPAQDATLPGFNSQAIHRATVLATEPLEGLFDASDSAGERGSLFVSRPYILKEEKLIDPIEGDDKLHPPIDNSWLIKHGLDYADLTIKDKDSDNDGFSNLEEYLAKTDPTDKKATPPSLNKLKLVSFDPKPFRLEFKGDPSGEGKEFQLNLKDLKGKARTQYKGLNDQIEGAPYKIIKYVPKEEINDRGVTVNVSELVVENITTNETITLVYNKETNDPTSFGTFRNLLTGEEMTLQKGAEFTLKPETSVKLKLIDISNTNAQIQDVSNGQIYRVLQIDSTAP